MIDEAHIREGVVQEVYRDTTGDQFFAILTDPATGAVDTSGTMFPFSVVDTEQRHMIAKGARFYLMYRTTYEGMPQYTTTRYVFTFIRPRP